MDEKKTTTTELFEVHGPEVAEAEARVGAALAPMLVSLLAKYGTTTARAAATVTMGVGLFFLHALKLAGPKYGLSVVNALEQIAQVEGLPSLRKWLQWHDEAVAGGHLHTETVEIGEQQAPFVQNAPKGGAKA